MKWSHQHVLGRQCPCLSPQQLLFVCLIHVHYQQHVSQLYKLSIACLKWDKTDEKPAVVAITTAAFVGVWALSGVVDRIDKLPVIGGLLELVGLVVTSWFVYRYLVFGPDR